MLVVVAGCSIGRPAEDATGEEIFSQVCSRCHSEDLSGAIGPPLGPGSNTATESDEFIVFTIHNGRGRMPSFSSVLSDAQVDRVVAYLRKVQFGES